MVRNNVLRKGCAPCTKITSDDNERAGRWLGTSKCGGVF